MMIFKQSEIREKYNKYMIEVENEDYKLLAYKVFIQSYKNNVIRIVCQYQINEKKNQNEEIEVESEYYKEIINEIQKYCAFAITDTSVKR